MMKVLLQYYDNVRLYDEHNSPFEDLKAISNLAFDQLRDLRHRGAFSTVASTFASVCLSCSRSPEVRTAALPALFFQVRLFSSCGSKLIHSSAAWIVF